MINPSGWINQSIGDLVYYNVIFVFSNILITLIVIIFFELVIYSSWLLQLTERNDCRIIRVVVYPIIFFSTYNTS